jgi:glycosyltransferase involved in cell wall biosynthesis
MAETPQATVSVVIACYKQAHLLPQAIESALHQTYAVEVILVNDGSPDNTAEVAARYPRVLLVLQENKGLGEARNTGFRASRGDYVVFLDADDELTPGAIEAHLNCFAEHPDAGFVVGHIDHIDLQGVNIGSPRWPVLQTNFYEELLKVNHVANTIAVMFRRAIIETLGVFDTRCSPAEDYHLLLRAARLSPSAHHPCIVAQYRRHSGNMSRNGVRMLRATHCVMKLECPLVRGDPRLRKAHRQGRRYWREYFGAVALKQAASQIRRREFLRAGRTLAAVVWYARLSVFVIPCKYRWQAFRLLKR